MFKKIIKALLSGNSHRRYSSSSSRRYSSKHNYYGHKHYQKKTKSIFSSMSFFSS